MDNNLLESDRTNKVFGNEKREKATIPALVTGYATLLALAIHVHFGWVVSRKSQGSNVIWSVAP